MAGRGSFGEGRFRRSPVGDPRGDGCVGAAGRVTVSARVRPQGRRDPIPSDSEGQSARCPARRTTGPWILAGLLVLTASSCTREQVAGIAAGASPSPPFRERGAGLGPDPTRIEEIRVSLDTGTVSGAGTDNQILIWFDNHRHRLTSVPSRAFAPGEHVTATLLGRDLPTTLGGLRRASIVLTMELPHASIASSWYCEYALLEVKLEGEKEFRKYLDSHEVGWLSQDEPPRRSTAYALQ